MRFLRALLDKQARLFEKGGKLEKLYPLYEANDSFLFTPGHVTAGASHVRDGLDVKRLMMTVVVALAGCVYMAIYNTGYQANLAIRAGAPVLDTWQSAAVVALGMSFDPDQWLACVIHGALYYLPVLGVTFAVGGAWEALFAIVRKHEINEGFLVTGMLFPLILPPTIPLWQVALGISFGVVIGKEIFGGTGMNVLNPALTARAFVFFAYPANMSGDTAWITAATTTDGVSGATWLALTALDGDQALAGLDWGEAFMGFVPGSMGETSALACLLGAAVLIITQIGLGLSLGSSCAHHYAGRLLADHAERGTWDLRDRLVFECGRFKHESSLCHFPSLAFCFGWMGLWHGLHGNRPGICASIRPRALPVWLSDWCTRGSDSCRKPSVSRRYDALDSLHEPIRACAGLFCGPFKRETTEGTVCRVALSTT